MATGNGSNFGAQQANAIAPLLGPLTNLTATGLVFWIVITQIPGARNEFREELKTIRTEYSQQVDKLAAAIRELTQEIKAYEARNKNSVNWIESSSDLAHLVVDDAAEIARFVDVGRSFWFGASDLRRVRAWHLAWLVAWI